MKIVRTSCTGDRSTPRQIGRAPLHTAQAPAQDTCRPIFFLFGVLVSLPVSESLTADALQRNFSTARIADAHLRAIVHTEIKLR